MWYSIHRWLFLVLLREQSASDCDNTSCEDFSMLSFDHGDQPMILKFNNGSRRGSENMNQGTSKTTATFLAPFGGKKDLPKCNCTPSIVLFTNLGWHQFRIFLSGFASKYSNLYVPPFMSYVHSSIPIVLIYASTKNDHLSSVRKVGISKEKTVPYFSISAQLPKDTNINVPHFESKFTGTLPFFPRIPTMGCIDWLFIQESSIYHLKFALHFEQISSKSTIFRNTLTAEM